MKRKLQTSVGRRLILLIVVQGIMAFALMGIAVFSLHQIQLNERYMYRFQALAIADIGVALETVGQLQELATHIKFSGSKISPEKLWKREELIEDFKKFTVRYRTKWQTVQGMGPDARRFRKDLTKAGMQGMLREETDLMAEMDRSFRATLAKHQADDESGREWDKVRRLRRTLATLLRLNIRYTETAHKEVETAAERIKKILIAIWIVVAVLSVFLGFRVHDAIAPRIQSLVKTVRKFQETGIIEKSEEQGTDEIAVLAHALDIGFAAIAERENERESFLAIAAHELKTPITSIHGFASMVIKHPDQEAIRIQALTIIERQAWRLSHLIEELFYAASARAGKLRFHPAPLEFSVLTKRVATEVESFLQKQVFTLVIPHQLSILGDESLLTQAVWNLLTCASAFSSPGTPIVVSLGSSGVKISLEVQVRGASIPISEMGDLFSLFRVVEYESGVGVRSAAVGLYLCREIAKLHNGALRVENISEVGPSLILELPV
jgi:signal transduction histidine kinase